MIQPQDDRRAPLTPQLALRVAVIGGFALAMFAIIFFRLWFLQVLNTTHYIQQASINRIRHIAIPAARGDVLDRSGTVLVDSKSAIDVQIQPPDLPVPANRSNFAHPPRRDMAVYRRLAGVLGLPTRKGPCRVTGLVKPGVVTTVRLAQIPCDVAQQESLLPYANVTVKRDVSKYVQYYLAERQNQFPGVIVEKVYLRRYPLGRTAAQLFGTVGPINPQEVKYRRYKGLSQNSIIGQSGLEYFYDKDLRGTDGQANVQVNALGQPVGDLKGVAPVTGNTLKLSLDLRLQQVGEQALQQSISTNPPANSGAFVAMNPENGEVYAMGSLPEVSPGIFTHPLSKAAYDQINSVASNYPLINRAIQTAGPDGSTFKPITATAALQSRAWSVNEPFDDTGQFCQGALCRHNSGGAAYGVVTLPKAIQVSSDVFFYNLGALTNVDPIAHPNGGALQSWAHLYGIGRKTGIDLGGEIPGNLPSPKWRLHVDALEHQCELGIGPYKGHGRHASCGIADGRPWSAGDNVNLAVGQGDVQVTPLQLAVAYSAIANGGANGATIVRPHLGLQIDSSDGTVLSNISPPPARHINVDPAYLDAIRAGLRAAASQPGGTSADVFGNFPEQVYGKTGTAQYNGQQDYSWYACFVPKTATTTPITIVVTVEQGGFGAVAAAPVARQMLSQWFFGKKGQYVAGKSTTL
jgi:penicillin-binding protein 2